MSSKAKRGEQLLNRIGDRLGMTECGKKWLTIAIDPFHDNPVDLKGLPDGSVGNSIVQFVQQTITVTAPTGITTGTWDCHIIDWNFTNNIGFDTGYSTNASNVATANAGNYPQSNLFAATGSGGFPNGGLQILAGPTGDPLYVQHTIGAGGSTRYSQQLTLPANYIAGKHRIIAKGFEVHNTTAQLYRGGSVCCYRSPVPNTDAAVIARLVASSGTGGLGDGPCRMLVMENPPSNLAAALLLRGSKQWGAEEGCYVVSAFHDPKVEVYGSDAVGIYMTNFTALPGDVPTPVQLVTHPIPYTATQWSGSYYNIPAISISEFDISGAYFSGLTPQTTLTLNWNVAIERFPTQAEADLEVLADPAPELDDVALKFYSHAVLSLPVGVPVKENGFGDWFKDVVSTASDFVAPVLSAIPHPAAQGLGMAIKGIDAVANREKYPVPRGPTPSTYLNSGQEPLTTQQAARQVNNSLIKRRNESVKEKNAVIRAKNEEIRARKALKAVKKK